MAEIKDAFEKATVDTIKQILKTNNDVDIKYEHHGGEDPYYTHTVSHGDTEIFYLKYAIPGMGGTTELRINGRYQSNWSEEAMKELNGVASDAWWTQKRREEEAKEKAKNDNVKKQQAEISSFLAKFLPKEETH